MKQVQHHYFLKELTNYSNTFHQLSLSKYHSMVFLIPVSNDSFGVYFSSLFDLAAHGINGDKATFDI